MLGGVAILCHKFYLNRFLQWKVISTTHCIIITFISTSYALLCFSCFIALGISVCLEVVKILTAQISNAVKYYILYGYIKM
jgi:hypothetical protein